MIKSVPNYDFVSGETWKHRDFKIEYLKASRGLFDFSEGGALKPKKFEVVAVVAGLPFSNSLIEQISSIQNKISKIIKGAARYWVLPNNLATEFIVCKWPEESWSSEKQNAALDTLTSLAFLSFPIQFRGFQINPDGCVVIRGYDTSGEFHRIRSFLRDRLDFVSSRQSSWYHIPIGRILEPVGFNAFEQLRDLSKQNGCLDAFNESIDQIHLVHEKQWYMASRTKLLTIYGEN